MAKKRGHARKAAAAAASGGKTTAANSGSRATVVRSVELTSRQVLYGALAALDDIAHSAHDALQQLRSTTAATAATTGSVGTSAAQHKRPRDEDNNNNDDNEAAARDHATAAALQRSSEVYAAMAQPHYTTLCTAVGAFALQLLPSLDDIVRRVALATQTPVLASCESYETAARLCTYYRAGAARVLSGLLDALLQQPGAFVLHSPLLLPHGFLQRHGLLHLPSLCSSSSSSSNSDVVATAALQQERRAVLSRAARKLLALQQMLLGAGEHVPERVLRQAALRFALEVVEDGVLAPARDGGGGAYEATYGTASAASAAGDGDGGGGGGGAVVRWCVPPELHAPCLRVLSALLLVCQPISAQVRACALRVVREMTTALHRGGVYVSASAATHAAVLAATSNKPAQGNNNNSSNNNTSSVASLLGFDGSKDGVVLAAQAASRLGVRADTVAAVVELQQLTRVLQHPQYVPLYTPAHETLERVPRRVFVVDDVATMTAAAAAAAAAAVSTTTTRTDAAVQQSEQQQEQQRDDDVHASPAVRDAAMTAVTTAHDDDAAAAAAAVRASETTPSTAVETARAQQQQQAHTQQSQTQQQSSRTTTTTATVSLLQHDNKSDDDDDDIPDIDMND